MDDDGPLSCLVPADIRRVLHCHGTIPIVSAPCNRFGGRSGAVPPFVARRTPIETVQSNPPVRRAKRSSLRVGGPTAATPVPRAKTGGIGGRPRPCLHCDPSRLLCPALPLEAHAPLPGAVNVRRARAVQDLAESHRGAGRVNEPRLSSHGAAFPGLVGPALHPPCPAPGQSDGTDPATSVVLPIRSCCPHHTYHPAPRGGGGGGLCDLDWRSMTTAMDADEQPEPESFDEELGSPGLTFESGLLVGVGVGIAVLMIVLWRRRKRKRRPIAATESPASSVAI